MKEKSKSKKLGGILLSLVWALSMILTPCAAFADTATVPMYLNVSEEPLVFDVTEKIRMTATQGSTTLVFDRPVTVTNNGTKKIQVSSIALNPASGWSVEASSTDFTTAAATALSFICGGHDFANGAYAPADAIAIGTSKTYTLEGQVSAKADLMQSAKVSNLVLTVEKAPLEIVTWADGTDEQIVAMVEAADAGKINLENCGWSVGDTRTVHLSAMEGAMGEGEDYNVQLVLMHAGEYQLADGSKCNFVVGQKNALKVSLGSMNSTDTNSGSWDGSAMRAWCNSTYKNAIPSTLQPIFKQFKTITAETYDGTTLQTSLDYFALPAEIEVFGEYARKYSNLAEVDKLFQFDWYKTEANRIKKYGRDKDDSINWWERSPCYHNSLTFCNVYRDGRADNAPASLTFGLAPFGCI